MPTLSDSRSERFLDYLAVPTGGGTATSGNTYLLPVYNQNVGASWTAGLDPSVTFTYFDQAFANNQSTSNGLYDWGSHITRFNVFNGSGSSVNYTFTFTFPTATVPGDLLLVVAGLAFGTTATVSQTGSLGGELHFPQSALAPNCGCPSGSSQTLLSGTTLSSGYTNSSGTDILNTGWALYQPTGSLSSLSLNLNQINGDGVGFTLAYVATPEPATLSIIGVSLLVLTFFRSRNSAGPSGLRRTD